jgi:hypothetical protein
MIRFRTETTLQVVEDYDSKHDEITEDTEETFKQGEVVDADVYSEDDHYADIQFANGSVATSVPKDSFEIV